MISFMVLSLSLGLNVANAATRSIDVRVKGMVCSFCAQGITRKFKSEDAVSDVNVSLEKHVVALQLKDGKDLPDEKINAVLKDAGYTVDKIDRK